LILARFSNAKRKQCDMDMQNQKGDQGRKRKPLQRPTLVYSVKQGEHQCGIYSREARIGAAPVWKARA
jgi:hypothetical protein